MGEADFEVPLLELQRRTAELAKFPGDPDKDREARQLQAELDRQRREVFSALTPWQKTQVARCNTSRCGRRGERWAAARAGTRF